MKKLMATMICSVSLLFLLGLVITITQAKEDASKDDPHKKLFETKCQQCHSVERIKEAHLTGEKAKETVEKMRKKEGANISKEDAESIYNYLGNYFVVPPSPPVVPVAPR
jgi:mono/diheme cytochrome c family protein